MYPVSSPSLPQAERQGTERRVVILADGDFPSHPLPLRLLAEAETLVCCDGAYQKAQRYASTHALTDDVYVIGDGDSLPSAVRQQLGNRFLHVADQVTNDLTKAVLHCAAQGWTRVDVLGATGLREDHTLGNISLLGEYLLNPTTQHMHLRLVSDFGTLRAFRGQASFDSFPRQQVSLFSLRPQCPLTSQGLEYPLDNFILDNWWKGTLNAALGQTFRVEGPDDALVVVFQTHEPKIAV